MIEPSSVDKIELMIKEKEQGDLIDDLYTPSLRRKRSPGLGLKNKVKAKILG